MISIKFFCKKKKNKLNKLYPKETENLPTMFAKFSALLIYEAIAAFATFEYLNMKKEVKTTKRV